MVGGITMGDLGLMVVKVPAADHDLQRYDRWTLVGAPFAPGH